MLNKLSIQSINSKWETLILDYRLEIFYII